jgi:hypothetical protein
MLNIASALVKLNAGFSIQRSMKSNRNGDKQLYLIFMDGRSFLFADGLPAELDGDDLSAVDWQVVATRTSHLRTTVHVPA